jgi:hypothetical protein
MKKRVTLKVIIFLCLAAVVYAGANIYNFSVSQDNDNADLSWTANGETSSMEFIVERKTSGTDYAKIATVKVNDTHSYQYQDRTIYKTTGSTYYYKVLLVEINSVNSGNLNIVSSSSEKMLIPHISGIKNTWGSIKAMFR